MQKELLQKGQLYFFLALLLLFTAIVLRIFLPYLSALILAITFAVLFYPWYEWFLKKLKGREILSALIVVILVVLIVLAPIVFFIERIVQEAQSVYTAITATGDAGLFTDLISDIETQINRYLPDTDISLNQILGSGINWLGRHFGQIFSGIAQVLLTVFLSLMALYYLFKDGDRLTNMAVQLSPLSDTYDRQIITKLKRAINSTVKGTLLIAVIQGALTGIGFALFGIPNAVLWGGLTVIAALIPTVGTSLIIAPGIAYLFLTDDMALAIGFTLWGVLIVGLVDNFLRPQFIKHGTAIHPFLILLSVLGGISLMGPIGFLGGPLILSFFLALLDIYRQEFTTS